MYFFYDENGQLYGLNYGGVNYFYIKNLQGDIIAIADIDGNIKVEYTYGAWGEPFTPTGILASTLGAANPYRYRGYYFDSEFEMYYLQSRYYSPSLCRFISPDAADYVNGSSLYAYCGNNPVNFNDPNGNYPSLRTLQDGIMNWLFKNKTPRNLSYIPFKAIPGASGYCFPGTGVINSLKYESFGIDGNLSVFVQAYAYNLFTKGYDFYNWWETNHYITILCLPVANWLLRFNKALNPNIVKLAKKVLTSDLVDAAITFLTTANGIPDGAVGASGYMGVIIVIFDRFVSPNIFLNKELRKMATYLNSHPNLLTAQNRDKTYIMSISQIITMQYDSTSYNPTWSTSFITGLFAVDQRFY